MNAQITSSVAQITLGRIARQRVFALVGIVVVLSQIMFALQPARAFGPDMRSLIDLVLSGQGDAALQQVAIYAQQLGSWMPAPDDKLVFDPYMPRKVRGSSLDYDDLPDCADPQVSFDEAACISQFRTLERQVRFGQSLFTTPVQAGADLPRPAFDDLLSTYIEEVGHSWQEYLYETDGQGSGPRTRQTSKAESERWAAGREYQIKRYILSLDGLLFTLSDEQRSTLHLQICEGYANPLSHEVPAYGAPQGWPHPDGWPTAVPTLDELQAFCGIR